MLEQLTVQNYALIESLELFFSPGFTVLSGETGAGKSIIIGALGLLLGDRGDASVIRNGSSQLEVSAVLRLPDHPGVQEFLEQRAMESEDGRIVLRRVIKDSGRNTITLQGSPITRKELGLFSQMLFDVHGQHEHQSLMRSSAQRNMLDSYAGLSDETEELRRLFGEMESVKKTIQEITATERDRIRERDMLSYAAGEIEAANLRIGEQEELERQVHLLSEYEHLSEAVDSARSSGSRALELLKESRGELHRASRIDEELQGESRRIETVLYELEDVLQVLRQRMEHIQLRPGELDEIQDRLMSIRRLEKKYGDTVEQVLTYAMEARKSLESLDHDTQRLESLQKEQKILQQRMKDHADTLSRKRNDAARDLGERITSLLRKLGMPHGSFFITVAEGKDESGDTVYRSSGKDVITFEIAPNKGEPKKPMQAIASGGEISRVMLALKSASAVTDSIDTVIFDEIDAGIGGSVAVNVARHLAYLGAARQVICITHLAAIAARADSHFVVDKQVSGSRTVTAVREVTGEERIAEVARMLSGDSDRDTALAHARELTEAAPESRLPEI